MTKLDFAKLYIDGQAIEATSGEYLPDINPASGEVICQFQVAGEADVSAAVEAAHRGFRAWSRFSHSQRGDALAQAAALLRQRKKELARLEVRDTGKPISEALSVDIDSAADVFDYFAGVVRSLHGHHYDLPHAFAYTRREPLGICAGIGAWNYPLQIASWKAAPALACGNAMVYKPSELTPLTTLQLAAVLTEAGLPDGAFNVVLGAGQVGELLSSHPDIAKVSLTGSVLTGKKVLARTVETVKYVTLELGGKSPLIIFEDAHLENAVDAAMLGNFYTQGEICSNGTRVFVHESIRENFLDRLIQKTGRLQIGDPMDLETDVGALISQQHREKVLSYIESGKSAGARLLTGGGIPEDPKLAGGFFLEPAVFDACRDDMTIVREEIFGPVMSVLSFVTEEEAIQRANDTPYGLSAGVFTTDLARAHRVVARLQAGTCWINNYNVTPIEMPFGGYKQSGLGRENSLAALEHYSQVKSVYVELGDVETPYK